MATETQEVLINIKVDSSEAIKRQQELKLAIYNQKKALDELTSGKKDAELAEAKLSSDYIVAESNLKQLTKQLNANQNVLTANAKSTGETAGAYADLSRRANEASAKAADLGAAYGKNDERFKAAAKEANALTQELKDIDGAMGRNFRKVGDYAGELKGLGETFKDIPGPIGKMAGGIDGVSTAFKGMSLASPVGWITPLIQLIVELTEKLKGNKEITDALAKAGGFLNGIFSFFTKIIVESVKGVVDFVSGVKSFPDLLKRVGDGIKENLINRLESFSVMGKAIVKILKGDIKEGFKDLGNGIAQNITGIENLGDKAVGAFKKLGKSLSDATSGGSKLAELEKLFETQNRNSQKLQLQYQTQAEKLRQLRDDESRSIQQRMKDNEQLGVVLKKQLADESKVANTQLQIAKLRIQQDGKTKENLDSLAEAETRLIDIKERITGQESEQLANLNSLRREATAKHKENLKIQAEATAKAAADELARLKSNADEAIKVLDYEVKMAKLKADEKNAGVKLSDQQAHAQKLADIDAQNAVELEKQTALFGMKQISEQQFNDAVKLANQERNTAIAQENAAFDEAQRQLKQEAAAIDFQNKYDTAVLNNENMAALEAEQLERKYQAELAAAEKTGADTALIDAKYSAMKQDLAKKEYDAKLSLASGFAGNIATIFGKNTKVGKAAASAQIAIDTYKGAMAAFASMQSLPLGLGIPAGIAAAAAVAVQGAKAIKDVWAVKSGLPGDGGGGGGATSVNTAVNATAANVTGSLVSRNSSETSQQAQQTAVSNALQANPTTPVLVVDNVTDAQANKANVKVANSL